MASIYLSDVADIINVARDHAMYEAKMDEEHSDALTSMLRGALSLMRDFGDYMGALEDLSKAWTIANTSPVLNAA